jgi:CheY-like chemotaxis protein
VIGLFEAQYSQNGSEKIKILVVEDDAITRTLYDKGLFDEVFDKKMVISGQKALLVYNAWHPDIIVLDIFIPELTGFLVLKEIRTTFNDKTTTIVMATSLHGKEDILSCMKLGVEGYIVKPLKLWKLQTMILSYYAKREPERARKAHALCQEILKKTRVRWLQDKDKSEMKNGENEGDGASGMETGKSEEAVTGE